MLGNVALERSELDEAVVACASKAFWTLEYIGYHKHADRALKVLRLDTKASICPEIFLTDAILRVWRSGFDHFSELFRLWFVYLPIGDKPLQLIILL